LGDYAGLFQENGIEKVDLFPHLTENDLSFMKIGHRRDFMVKVNSSPSPTALEMDLIIKKIDSLSLKIEETPQITKQMLSIRDSTTHFEETLLGPRARDMTEEERRAFLASISEEVVQKIWGVLVEELQSKKNASDAERDAMDVAEAVNFNDDPDNAKNTKWVEKDVQCLMTFVHRKTTDLLQKTGFVHRDTHKKCAPVSPLYKPDVCWVDGESASVTGRVCWRDIVAVDQYKPPSLRETYRKGAAVQLMENIIELERHQRTRQFLFVSFANWRRIEFFRYSYSASQSGARVLRSGQLSFIPFDLEAKKVPVGFRMYLAFRSQTHDALGFSQRPQIIPATLAKVVDLARCDVIRDVTEWEATKPRIYSSVRDGEEVAVKVHQRDDHFETEVAVFTTLSKLPRSSSFILQFVTSSPTDRLLVVKPLARWTLSDALFTTSLLKSVCQGAVWILTALHNSKQFYCDPSPSNVLVLDDGSARWNDFSDVQPFSQKEFSSFCGTHRYASPNLMALANCALANPICTLSYEYTTLDDCRAVFFTILEFCMVPTPGRSRKLPWGKEGFQVPECWTQKLVWVTSPNFDRCQDGTCDFLRRLFHAWFQENNYNEGLQILTDYGEEEVERLEVLSIWHYANSQEGSIHAIKKCGNSRRLKETSFCSVKGEKPLCRNCFSGTHLVVCACSVCSLSSPSSSPSSSSPPQ